MRLRWTIKVYEKGGADHFRVKVNGTPNGYTQPWVSGFGDAPTLVEAFSKATARIAELHEIAK